MPRSSGPRTEKVVELGVLTLLFLPGQLTDGIEAPDDSLIDVRNGAYAVSFSRRHP